MRKLSIGVRLTLWYLLLFAAAQLVFATGMWFFARRSLYRITDDTLQGQIDDLTNFLEAQKKNATVAKLQEEVSNLICSNIPETTFRFMTTVTVSGFFELTFCDSMLWSRRQTVLWLNLFIAMSKSADLSAS